ncbi:MAG: lytic murein transglycosylase B [Pseudomonadota bacterium]
MLACTLLAVLGAQPAALALDTQRADVAAFIDELVNEHEFDRAALSTLLAGATRKDKILEAISRPAEKAKPWHDYRDIFIQPKRINAGVAFWAEHEQTIARISEQTGVPGEILVGIIGVETFYGRITGNYRVLDALATLGFDYPPRATFFRRELKEFLLLAREEQVNVEQALGSYAGAMGSPQFIPSSYRAYAVDSDGDGRRDLFGSWEDIIGSVANYFVRHRWQRGAAVVSDATLTKDYHGELPRKNALKVNTTSAVLSHEGVTFEADVAPDAGARLIVFEGAQGPEYYVGFDNFYVITRYNRSSMYAMAVWQLGNAVAQARAAATDE